MFREMRRHAQQVDTGVCEEILRTAPRGVLSLAGDDGYPYGIPMNFVYEDGKFYFHCAGEGHKIDAIDGCPKVSFCVIDKDDVVPEKLTTVYRSVIVFGKAYVLDDERKIAQGARIIGEKYLRGMSDRVESEIAQSMPKLTVIRMDIEHMTGKEGVELTAQKKPDLFDSE